MFNLKKIGTAVAIVALTSFGAISAQAATVFALPGDAGLVTPDLDDVLVLNNSTGILPDGRAGTLSANTAFSNSFSLTVVDATPGDGPAQNIKYLFSVTQEFTGTGNSIGIANLTFAVARNGNPVDIFSGDAGNPLIYTNGSGAFIGATTSFIGPWVAGDTIDWTITGTPLSNGGSYDITVTAVPVPLPASVLMLIGALAGLGFIGRMKRSRFAAA